MLESLIPPTPNQELALSQPLAAWVIWWQSTEPSLRQPDHVIAQVLEFGDFDSVPNLRRVLGDHRLAAVLQRAQPGWFSPRSGSGSSCRIRSGCCWNAQWKSLSPSAMAAAPVLRGCAQDPIGPGSRLSEASGRSVA